LIPREFRPRGTIQTLFDEFVRNTPPGSRVVSFDGMADIQGYRNWKGGVRAQEGTRKERNQGSSQAFNR